MKLIYRGAYDDNWKEESNVTEKYLENAIQTFLNDPSEEILVKKLSMGCSIKWVENKS